VKDAPVDHRTTQLMTRTTQLRTGRRSRLRVAGVALALAAVVAGCSTPSNNPTDYDDTTKSNYVQGCTQDAVIGTSTTVLGEGLSQETCECAYDWIVQNVPFDEFKDLDDQLADDPNAVPANINDGIADACPGFAASGSAGPTTTAAGDSGTSVPE
jgi:hypothetical protein